MFCFISVLRMSFRSLFEGRQDRLEEAVDVDALLSKLEEFKVIATRHRTAIEVMFVTSGRLSSRNSVVLV